MMLESTRLDKVLNNKGKSKCCQCLNVTSGLVTALFQSLLVRDGKEKKRTMATTLVFLAHNWSTTTLT